MSVIVPCYRSHETLRGLLEALESELAGTGAEIIVADSSGDGEARRVSQAFPTVRVLESARRMYPGEARNAGAAAARHPWLLFIDSDCLPAEGWGGTLRRLTVEGGGKVFAGAVRNGTPRSLRGSLQFYVEFSQFTPLTPRGARQFAPSYLLLVPREAFLACGGFPGAYLSAEDLVFCLRLRDKGFDIEFIPEWSVLHLNRTHFRVVFRHFGRLGFWSGRVRRHYPRMRGGWLRWCPFLIPLVSLQRWVRLLPRLARDRSAGACCRLAVLLLALPAYLAWGGGFTSGLYASKPAEDSGAGRG
ncbi:MAG: glycosyltransferase [Acidobacteria bacterium]|nr:glycosyltransferase [Acidobacteriota bacterium]